MPTNDLLPPESCKVYTPRSVADAMVGALKPERGATWLEPSVGRGVFLSALASAGVARKKIVAVDLDPVECQTDILAVTHRGIDFLSWSQTRRRGFDRIVGNPPYVPLSRLDLRLRETAFAVNLPRSELTIPSNSNIWYAFLCRCLQMLKTGGDIALVLPAAWDFADYAGVLRDCIPGFFRQFITFRSRRPIFDEVQDGSVIIIGRGFALEHQQNRRVECRDKNDLVTSIKSICPAVGFGTPAALAEKDRSNDGVPLGELLEIRLGGVTGHVEYFLLTEERRRALKLPREALTPVLSRSRHLARAVIDRRSWLTLLRKGERVWLFNPSDKIVSHPAVRRYLSLALAQGGCERDAYKIKNRTPWFRIPLPSRVDGFMSGMTRTGPWLALRSMRYLNATNTLYVVTFKERLSRASKAALALAMLTSGARKELRERCRHYPDGLMKHEPGDLTSIRLPPVRNAPGAAAAYHQAVRYLLAGHDEKAFALADAFFSA